MQRILATDPASLMTTRIGSAFTSITAAGAGDAAAVNGITIDREATGMQPAAVLALHFSATLTAAKTLNITQLKVQDSADGAIWADYRTLAAPGVVLSATGVGQVAASVSLSSARRYVRSVFTPDLTAAAADVATLVSTWSLTGGQELPAAA